VSCTDSKNLIRKNNFSTAGSLHTSMQWDRYTFGVFLKENIYSNTHTLKKLNQNNDLCISNATAETLHQDAPNTRKTVNACITEFYEHFQNLI
jgi:hypothetical protein